MKERFITIVFLFSLTGSVLALDLPPIKSGFWETATTTDGQSTTTSICVDSNTLEDTFKNSVNIMGSQCTQIEMKKVGAKYSYNGACNLMGTTIQSMGELSGDFSSKYTSVVKSTMTPPLMGRGSSTTTQNSTYKGPCPKGVVPGDIIMANGQKFNVNKMLQQMPSNMGDMMKGLGEMGVDPEKMAEMLKGMQQ